MEYWSDFEGENDGKNQTFFACADIVSILLLLGRFNIAVKYIDQSF
jgi:hypothetical protein